ncbi:MAG: CoA ester lyase [Micrococcus sp.]|nr:CoA ester lyase [Micrococcus sp.]
MNALTLGPAVMFTPADRPERFAKALERADAVILDLEDAVTPADRPAARDAVAQAWHQRDETGIDVDRVVVRVNPAGTSEHDADLAMLRETGWRTLMLAKAESAAQVDALVDTLGEDTRVVALCETARGILAAGELAAHDHVVALMWGAEDLVASMGGTSSRLEDGSYRDVIRHARSTVLLAAAAYGAASWDAVYLDLKDHVGLAAEAADAVAVGCAATVCLHPGQVPVIRETYRPTAAASARARAVLDEAQHHPGAFSFQGSMVDEVVLAQARITLARAER